MLRGLMHYFPDINIRTDDGSTALILAARFGHYQLVSMLLKRDGVDVTAADKVKMTAIHYSACNGHYGCLQPLLAHVKGNQGVLDAQDAMHRTALILAAEYGHISCVKELIRVGANVNVVDSQSRSALHRAVSASSCLCGNDMQREQTLFL